VDIAILGMGCRLPGGAATPERFWSLLVDGVDAVTEIPADRFDVDAIAASLPDGGPLPRWGGFVEPLDAFDAAFFGISPREARRVDPQQRLLLEVAWEALEDGGQPPGRLAGSATGVFVGVSTHDYGDRQQTPEHRAHLDAYVGTGGAQSIVANRLSYLLDLRGPSLVVDTACSSSLTALHLACRSLEAGECDLAVVGGTNVILNPEASIMFSRASMLAPDGRCKAFSAEADGYVRSEGAGAVVLKPLDRALADDDPIRAVVRATGTNQDGRTAGISVPSAEAQAALFERTLAEAGLDPAAVGYVEAHGTGTAVGDPLEAAAIGRVYGAGRAPDRRLPIGSAKSNVGHLEAAAGMAGLLKAALVVGRRRIPASLHCATPNPAIPFDDLGLRVPISSEPWPAPDGPALAGVNGFGFGGANAHAVLAEAPARSAPPPEALGGDRLLALSARSAPALRDLAAAWVARLRDGDGATFRDLCHTAALRRDHHPHRLAVVASSRDEAAAALAAHLAGDPHPDVAVGEAAGSDPGLAFVLSGMGAHAAGAGRGLLRDEPAFRRAIAACDETLSELAGWSIAEALTDDDADRLADADRSHVVNLGLQVGIAATLAGWGITPDAVTGHSSGETGAAVLSGALSLADGVRLAHHRGTLLHTAAGAGGMLAAAITASEAEARLTGHEAEVCLAAVNGPTSVTLSGAVDTLDRIAAELAADGRWCRRLEVDIPYHAPQLDGLEQPLRDGLAELRPGPARVPLVSTSTGSWVEGERLDADHWWANLRQPVRFDAAVGALAAAGRRVVIELGAHPVLTRSIAESLDGDSTVLPTLRRGVADRRALLRTVAGAHVRGRPVDWVAMSGGDGRCVRVPTYPWQRERHWFDVPTPPPGAGMAVAATARTGTGTGTDGVRDSRRPLLGRRLRTPEPTWERLLDDPALGYLDGHVVHGTATFPAAGHVAIGLAAVGATDGDGPRCLADVELMSLLPVADRTGRLLQCSLDPSNRTLAIHSGTSAGEPSWRQRAAAVVADPVAAPDAVDLAALRARCSGTLPVDRFYRDAATRFGLAYHGPFRSLTALHRGRDEALGRIAPDEAPEDLGDPVHPALLDAAFQVLLAPLGPRDLPASGATLLPVGIDRVTWHAPPRAPLWSHAAVERRDGTFAGGTVRLLDDDGRVLLTCEGLRFAVVGQPARPSADHLHEEVWEPEPPREAATAHRTVAELAGAARSRLDELADAAGFAGYYGGTEPALNALAAAFVGDALAALGIGEQPSATAETRVAPQHRRYVARLLALVGEVSTDPIPGADRVLDDPAIRPGLDLVRETGSRLAATLRGEEDPRAWLIAGEAGEALAGFYAATPSGRFYNSALAEAVAAACPPARGLRILEVGAGTGATTDALLERLGGRIEEYRFTDVSAYFVRNARQRLGDRPGLRFDVLDLEEPLAEPDRPFDVIVGADVVHATADVAATLERLGSLLAPGGLLVLLEPIRRSLWLELIFGQVEGWWRFADSTLRPDHPLLPADRWSEVLRAVGFSAVEAVHDTPPDGGPPMQTVLLAQTPAAPAPAGAAQRRFTATGGWLVLADRGGVGTAVAAALRERGDRCAVARADMADRRDTEGCYALAPTDEAQWVRLLDELGPGPLRVVDLWALDAPVVDAIDADAPDAHAPDAHAPDADALLTALDVSCGGLVTLLRAAQGSDATIEAVWLVTAGAQTVAPDEAVDGVTQAPLWGFGRVLRNERGGRCHLLDLDPGDRAAAAATVLAELDEEAPPDEVVMRGGRRHRRRMRRPLLTPSRDGLRRRADPDEETFRARSAERGALDSIHLGCDDPDPLRPGQVEIRVRAAALNFRDVMIALGLLRAVDAQRPFGMDVAGVVTACDGVAGIRVGDEVLGFGLGTLGSRVVLDGAAVARKPSALSFAEAATLPVAFVTAQASLCEAAHVAAGERVLVHAATGGVGLAALQVCRREGAEVLATAGTPEKRAHLRDLGIEHVMDSRTLDFADEVRAATVGEGVDVVLSALDGAGRTASLELLRRGGRFVDLAVRDLGDDVLRLAPFTNGLTYCAWGDADGGLPPAWGEVLCAVVDDVADGRLQPLPMTTYDLAEAADAVRHLSQGRHIGKVVVTVDEPHYWVVPTPRRRFDPDGTYLVVGGLGGFGLALAGWLVDGGARHVVLTSRRGRPRPDDEAALDDLRAAGAAVSALPIDAADRAAMADLLERIRTTMPPLRGVVHAAMVLDDELLGRLDHDRCRAVLAPKVAGAWNLHALTADDDLDLFLLCSSASSLIGVPTQSSYAAANAFLDRLAVHRRARGRPALTVNWGAVSDAGYVARHPELHEPSRRAGVEMISAAEAFTALERALDNAVARIAVGRVDWARWTDGPRTTAQRSGATAAGGGTEQHDLEDGAAAIGGDRLAAGEDGDLLPALVRRTAAVLETAPDRVDPARPLTDMGLDSLMAVELQTILQRDLGLELSIVDLLEGATLAEVAEAATP
jgi:acyl transferase domain-containing protein/NADPH:quinone reductase-like Zn-dependent oxidoreductase/NAD(P)-dependent dehydrogenase (short-subunit alcohol dehydrogenase family)